MSRYQEIEAKKGGTDSEQAICKQAKKKINPLRQGATRMELREGKTILRLIVQEGGKEKKRELQEPKVKEKKKMRRRKRERLGWKIA